LRPNSPKRSLKIKRDEEEEDDILQILE